MKLLRVKLTDIKPFRSLQPGFEYYFRTSQEVEDELNNARGLEPFVCAGPNGSGKSNLLELLAAIFYQLEVLRVRRNSFLPNVFFYDPESNPTGIPLGHGIPDAFELEYWIQPSRPLYWGLFTPTEATTTWCRVGITKLAGQSPEVQWLNQPKGVMEVVKYNELLDAVLPEHVLAYSSGENEIVSLPFFKMRFLQFDDYWNSLSNQDSYGDQPETRLTYLDGSYSEAMFLCHSLFDQSIGDAIRAEIEIQELTEFRIAIRHSIPIDDSLVYQFGDVGATKEEIVHSHPALSFSLENEGEIRLRLTHLFDDDQEFVAPGGVWKAKFTSIINQLKRCATCYFTDTTTDTLFLDYFVTDATKQAFQENFTADDMASPIRLFQAFQLLLNLNLFSVSERSKNEVYKSDSDYVKEMIPTIPNDQRVFRFDGTKFKKAGVNEPLMLKSLSDGEHQLLHSLGLCLLFKNTSSLFLLDEPETHFNPDWRSKFITRLRECFNDSTNTTEMFITTHAPFLVSDSKPNRVLVVKKEDGKVCISHPDYNTFGASINKITMSTFDKRETIGGHAQAILEELRSRFVQGDDKQGVINELNRQLGDSVEKVLLIKTILDSMEKPR